MAKIVAPLLSIEARGTVGEVLTFSQRSSGAQVRYQRAQKDYVNAARKTWRTYYQVAVSWWHQLTQTEQDEWIPIGRSDP